MAMSEERRNEIAYRYVQNKIRKEGFGTLDPNNTKRMIGNSAKDLNISMKEAQEFVHGLVIPLVQEAFPLPKYAFEMSKR